MAFHDLLAPQATKPYEFIRFGAIDAAKPYEFIGFGAMDVAKPYKFVRFGAIDVAKPYRIPNYNEMVLELVCGADFWCNRHCRTSPVVLEGFGGQVWPKICQQPAKSVKIL